MSQTQANEDEANRDCSTSDNMSDETHDLINKILDKVTKLRQGLKQDFEKRHYKHYLQRNIFDGYH